MGQELGIALLFQHPAKCLQHYDSAIQFRYVVMTTKQQQQEQQNISSVVFKEVTLKQSSTSKVTKLSILEPEQCRQLIITLRQYDMRVHTASEFVSLIFFFH
jgi:hypothetical protein